MENPRTVTSTTESKFRSSNVLFAERINDVRELICFANEKTIIRGGIIYIIIKLKISICI